MEQNIISEYLGWSAWILLLIPLVLFVRLVSRRSRWSVARILLVSILGVAVASLWLHYAGTGVGEGVGALGGKLGSFLSGKLDGATGKPIYSFIISTVLLFLWGLGALMDAVIATARFYINKPYVREVVREVVKEVEVPRPERKPATGKPAARKTAASQKQKTPEPRPAPGKEISSIDEAPDFRIPAASILKDGSASHHAVTKGEVGHSRQRASRYRPSGASRMTSRWL